MKSRFLIIALTATGAICSYGQTVEQTPYGARIITPQTVTELQFFTPASVRVVKYPAATPAPEMRESLSVIAHPTETKVRTIRTDSTLTLRSPAFAATVSLTDGSISYTDSDGKLLTSECGTLFSPVDDAARSTYAISQRFRLADNEAIYGLGNYENGTLSQRGCTHTLQPGNIEDGIPVMQSVKGYGIIWDNYSPIAFSDNAEGMSFTSSAGDYMDYYFMYGGNADGVIRQIRTLTGKVPMFPLWSFGFWQSRERYKSQDELLEVVARHRKLGVPIDGIIQDWQYWGNNYQWNAMEFLNPGFHNPQLMMDSVHSMNAHAIISIWSSFGPQTKQYRELDSKGLLFNIATWPESGIDNVWPPRMDYPSGVRVYNPYSAEARDIYWKHLTRLHDFGMDGWWMDSTEPDHFNVTEADLDTPTGMGSFRSVRGAFPLMTVGGVYDHQRQVSDSKRVFILTRSGWTGQQRYGCNVWSGDVSSTWEMLRNTVPALLNFTLTGNPNTNSDIGGFFCGAYNNGRNDNFATRNPQFQELYVRWLQMGAFTPMMRSHGTDIKREIYYFGKEGEPVYDAIRDAIRLRYRLLPYIYSTAWMVTDGDYSYMRALWMDFPADTATHNCHTQFMFGPALLAAPVLTAQYTPEKVMNLDANTGWNRTTTTDGTEAFTVDFTAPRTYGVYLPAGTEWYDFHSGELLQGGDSVSAATTLGTIPLYVRAGAIIPVGPEVQYATEKPWDDLEIRVYPGADGRFTLYEDEGDNYNYENGAYSTIEFRWNDKSNRLTIGKRTGDFPGMLANRLFRVKNMATGRMAEVNYNGASQTVRL